MDDLVNLPLEKRTPEDQYAFEQTYVKRVYDAIAPHYTAMRTKRWNVVNDFLNTLHGCTTVLDAGCGNGKYFFNTDVLNGLVVPLGEENLSKKRHISMFGVDGSMSFLQLVYRQNYTTDSHGSVGQNPPMVVAYVDPKEVDRRQVACADLLSLPYRDCSFDALISIAVVHHMCTPVRRLASLTEFCRVLVHEGCGLITGWTTDTSTPYRFEGDADYQAYQTANNSVYNASDSFVNWKLPPRFISKDTPSAPLHNTSNDDNNIQAVKVPPARKLNQSNTDYRRMIADWHNNVSSAPKHTNYHRYYHMFQLDELEQLLLSVTYIDQKYNNTKYGFEILVHGKDEENYYCIVKKIKLSS